MDLLEPLLFISDAERLALAGLACWIFSGFCLVMEQLRNRRRSLERLERVGWVPWTPLFMASAMVGGGCLTLGVPAVLATL
ncbi:MAG: hypothetical protein V2J51_05800 [Erythrobacter sp.]|jgi:hypothetical protein|nr:hypothetical protein [Erythrobacter sp.]